MSQPFTATVIAARQLHPGWFRLVLKLDEAVDVVRFDSFSNLRRQIRAELGPDGYSKERTSDGEPHVRLDL
ncbi:MAG: glyoxalase superfamily protein [Roseovarius sp.]